MDEDAIELNFDLNFDLDDLDDVPPALEQQKHFNFMTDEEISSIALERNEKSTSYATSWGVRIFTGEIFRPIYLSLGFGYLNSFVS